MGRIVSKITVVGNETPGIPKGFLGVFELREFLQGRISDVEFSPGNQTNHYNRVLFMYQNVRFYDIIN